MTIIVSSSTKEKPTETFSKLEYENEIDLTNPKFKIGDVGRTYHWKSHFEKGQTKRRTYEHFKIIDVMVTVPWTYKLYDLK